MPGGQTTFNGRRVTVTHNGSMIADLDWNSPEENMANARLIAAAPELLTACKAADRLLLQVATLANNPDTIRYWPGGLREQVLDWLKHSPADKAISKATEGSL